MFGAYTACFTEPNELIWLLMTALHDCTWRDESTAYAIEGVAPHTFAARAEQLMAEFGPVLDARYAVAYG
jgi:hypothetical protein